jgi:hypothetical protein
MVSGAVAGDDLQSVARSAAGALGCRVAIAIPALGPPVVCPANGALLPDVAELGEYAEAVVGGTEGPPPASVCELIPVRIGQEIAGVVAAFGDRRPDPDRRPWIEAAAAAAAVAALMRDAHGDAEGSIRHLLIGLASKPPVDTDALLVQARRLGFEFEHGGIAVCARSQSALPPEATSAEVVMLADAGDGRVLGLVPMAAADRARHLAEELHRRGATVGLSTPRHDPADLHGALREAELIVALDDRILPGQEETYRLLIGVLLRDPGQLEELRAHTVSPLAQYDAAHDTDLLATLEAFLSRHGSTTETAEALQLHRHTVGYRLARVHEVSGLSPYESAGRERLGLGLKAAQILGADACVVGNPSG